MGILNLRYKSFEVRVKMRLRNWRKHSNLQFLQLLICLLVEVVVTTEELILELILINHLILIHSQATEGYSFWRILQLETYMEIDKIQATLLENWSEEIRLITQIIWTPHLVTSKILINCLAIEEVSKSN